MTIHDQSSLVVVDLFNIFPIHVTKCDGSDHETITPINGGLAEFNSVNQSSKDVN